MTVFRITAFLLLLPATALAQEPASAPAEKKLSETIRGDLPANDELKRLSLEEALKAAFANEPRIKASRSEAEALAAKAYQGRMARLQGSYEGLFAPMTELRGNPLQSDTGDFPLQPGRQLGIFTRHQISLVIPIFTFGKLSALSDLADIAEETGEPLVERSTADVALDVKKAYYGALLLDDLLDSLAEAATQLEGARKKIQEGLAEDSGDFTEADLYKLDVIEGEIVARAAQARAALALARSGLRTLTGASEPLHPKEDFLAPVPGELPSLEEVKAAAVEARPEVRLLEQALKARTQEVKIARGALLPDIGFLFTAMGAFSNVVDNQTSPFAFDPFNQALVLGGVGIRYSLDIGVKIGKVKEAEAARAQLAYLRDAALGGIGIEIEKAYGEAKSAKERYLSREEADKAAKKWVRAVLTDFTVGGAETRDIMEALLAAGANRAQLLQAIFEYNMAIAALNRAVGREVLIPKAEP